MEGKEGVGELVIVVVLDSFLARQGIRIGEICAPSTATKRTEVLAGMGMVQVWSLSQGFELGWAFVEGSVVDGAAAGSGKG